MSSTDTAQQNNPLSAYFRTPKLYTTLPSKGLFYPEDGSVIELPPNGELPVFPMTTRDEVFLKNPDALLNGDAVASLIKSCVPYVKDPMKMISNDIDTLLIAIRGASGGDEVEVTAECPECAKSKKGAEPIDLALSVNSALSSMSYLEDHYVKELPNGLTVEVRPFLYSDSVQAGITSFQSTRSMQSISQADDDMTRLKLFNDSFVKLANLNFELTCNSVIAIKTPAGDEISDPKFIREFLENCDKESGKAIEALVQEVNDVGVNKELEIECPDCKHQFTAPINFDPVNFFTAS